MIIIIIVIINIIIIIIIIIIILNFVNLYHRIRNSALWAAKYFNKVPIYHI